MSFLATTWALANTAGALSALKGGQRMLEALACADAACSMAALITSYGNARPGEVPTVMTVLRNFVLPALGYRRLDSLRLNRIITDMPASSLYAALDDQRQEWSERVRRRLPEGSTYHKAYCRVLKRLMAHGERTGLVHPDQYTISPPWHAHLDLLSDRLGGLPTQRRSAMRVGFRKLARWATKKGLSPADLDFSGVGGRVMEEFLSSFPADRQGGFYQARRAWNLMSSSCPHLGQPEWPSETPRLHRGVPIGDWPHCLERGLKLLVEREGLGTWSQATIDSYRSKLSGYLGTLKDLGFEPSCFLAPVEDGADAIRVLFQGVPPEWSIGDASIHADRMISDPSYGAQFLESLRGYAGSYDGRASGPNPFLSAVITELVGVEKLPTAIHLATRTLAINRGMLGMTERHVEWCRRILRQLNTLAKRSPSRYSLKKRAVFRSPELWLDLVKARKRLRDHTEQIRSEMTGAQGSRRRHCEMRWAVSLRNEVIFTLLLCYPLRAKNYSQMRLGEHYDNIRHRIFFQANETKNHKEIDYELPEQGPGYLGNVRQLVDQYLEKARPLLLSGRDSDFFFVPHPKGGVGLGRHAINSILLDISRKFLDDVLPEGCDLLNPHLFRHAAASYHLAIGNNLNLAAQILNDAPSTVSRSYADILENKKEATKRFLSGFGA